MRSIHQFLQKPWLYVVIILLGVSIKFYHVDYRYFWYDEISTIQHTSGNQVIYDEVNKIKNITFFTDQLHLKTQHQTVASQLKGLYNSTNLNPLHYTFLMVWYRIVGDDDVHYRWFNILIVLLTIPVLFLLVKNLFSSDLAGWIVAGLYAISPYFHYYAHEARYNILLIFIVSLANLMFIQALQKKRAGWWIGYIVVGILSLYASVMSGLILFGHLVYTLFFKKDKWIQFGICSLAIALGYLPWILSMILSREEISSSLAWQRIGTGNLFYLRLLPFQFTGLANVFVNFTPYSIFGMIFYNFEGIRTQLIVKVIITVFILIAIVHAFRNTPRKTAYFVLLIILPHCLFYYISDTVRNAAGSVFPRYQALNFIGVLLFLSGFLGRKIEKGKYFYLLIYLFIVTIGLISISAISKNRCWQVPLGCKENISEAQLFSEQDKPLLITDYFMPLNVGIGGFFAILNRCDSENIDVLHLSPDLINIDELLTGKDYSEIYVTHASDELVKNLKSRFGERMDSLEIEGISPTWQININ